MPRPLDRAAPLTPGALKQRSLEFAVQVARLCRSVRGRADGRVIASQLFRSATSVAANYRAACRARSLREFVAKLGLVVEECDETQFWLELIVRMKLSDSAMIRPVRLEADQPLSIFVVARATARKRLEARPHSQIHQSINPKINR